MPRKQPPRSEPRPAAVRAPKTAVKSTAPRYAALLAHLRGPARVALAVTPLLSVLGTIHACGGAPPVDPIFQDAGRSEVGDGGASDASTSDDVVPTP